MFFIINIHENRELKIIFMLRVYFFFFDMKYIFETRLSLFAELDILLALTSHFSRGCF